MQLDWGLNLIALLISGVLLGLVATFLARSKRLLSAVILLGAFSMLISLCYVLMDAPDVAMTEVALGSCLSTCVMLNMLKATGSESDMQYSKAVSKVRSRTALVLCLLLGGLIAWQGLNIAYYGDLNAPVNAHTTRMYLDDTSKEIGIPAFVAAILGSYRGFDTLGETTVIALAGCAVMLILSFRAREDEK